MNFNKLLGSNVYLRNYKFTLTKHRTYLLTYLHYVLSAWDRVLLEKVTGSAASQEIPHIFGTRRFLTILTSARQLSLS
jgi:hypothetical protein